MPHDVLFFVAVSKGPTGASIPLKGGLPLFKWNPMTLVPSSSVHRSPRPTALAALPAMAAALLSACSPALNWREIRPADADGLVGTFPCKPDHRQRQVRLVGLPDPVDLHVWSCEADGATWALSHARLGDVLHVAPALRALAQAQRGNVEAAHAQAHRQQAGQPVPGGHERPTAVDLGAIAVPGMTPQLDARGWRLQGLRPSAAGSPAVPLRVTSWHFSHGLVVFQASVWEAGPQAGDASRQEASDVFLRGLHFPG